MDSYEGLTDPYEHIDHFRTIMHIQRATDAVLCQVFPATLKGQARTWFYSLPRGNIRTFDELAKLFAEQFISNRRIIKDSSHLSGIRQNEGESLKEYFQRFSTEARQIPGVDPELLRGVFLGGLRPGPFYSSLMRETVRSYADLIYRVEAQISADEAINAHRKQFEQPTGKRKTAPENINQQSRSEKFVQKGNQSFPPRPLQHQQYDSRLEKNTPLNTSRANVLMAIQDEKNVKWPHPSNINSGNQEQYCHFHRSRGHTTEACKQLKEEIERLICQGYLGRFIQNQPTRPDNAPTGGQENNRQVVGEIAMIAGRPLLSTQSIQEGPKQKKSRLDYPIIFDDTDLEGVQVPHQDPLIISAGIGDPCYNIKMILLDNGSSVDILFYSTFLSMGLTKEELQPVVGPLYGLDNLPIQAEGTITLPIVLGEFPRQVTRSIQFVVVKLKSPYNAICGRPLQSIFGIVSSVIHHKIKFSTPNGIGTVCGN